MVDIHSHILPCMDDGSKSVEESVRLLRMLRRQGVDTVAATPHFYANDETVAHFFARRAQALDRLRPALSEDAPAIRMGAEVRYYEGISRLPDLHRLCIEGTELLLLEMPVMEWTESVLRELLHLSGSGRVRLLIAHIERYIGLQKRSVPELLLENDVLMQVNASCFLSTLHRHAAFSRLRHGQVHFLGSDCHNTTRRPPRLDEAYTVIGKKMGQSFVNQMQDYADSFFVREPAVL